MEFDTSLNFRKVASYEVKSEKELEPFMHSLWDRCVANARNTAQAGEAEIWLDYSDTLRTRHMAVMVEPVEGGYRLTFRCGSKPSRIGDAVMMLCILCAFWLGSKVLVPQPPKIDIIGAVVSLAMAGCVAFFSRKSFGEPESEEIIKSLQEI